jgi:hypothetical protein
VVVVRSALLLFGGLVLLGAGIAVIALGVPYALVVGPVLIVAGLGAKVVGFLVTGDTTPTPSPGTRRTVTTLGAPAAERTRGGVPMTRSTDRPGRAARAAAARTARSSEAARQAALAPSRARRGAGRRAS